MVISMLFMIPKVIGTTNIINNGPERFRGQEELVFITNSNPDKSRDKRQ
jgi:hypothetical protein